jgi:hypothetical protein
MRRFASIVVLVGFVGLAFGSGGEEGAEGSSSSSAASSPECESCKKRCQEANAVPEKKADEVSFTELVVLEHEVLHSCEKKCVSVCE